MNKHCEPYQRKTLYLVLTIPMIAMYVVIAAYLWNVARPFFIIYIALFITVTIAQSYVCVYFECPYVGRFAPCVGGFCLPSSQIARLFKNVKRTKRRFNILVNIAFASFLGIIILPMYFLYQGSVFYLLIYLGIVLAYASSFLWLICPVCGTRHICPGGQTSTKLRDMLSN
jgi:hypothetical protein